MNSIIANLIAAGVSVLAVVGMVSWTERGTRARRKQNREAKQIHVRLVDMYQRKLIDPIAASNLGWALPEASKEVTAILDLIEAKDKMKKQVARSFAGDGSGK